jgi:hypothetical protein
MRLIGFALSWVLLLPGYSIDMLREAIGIIDLKHSIYRKGNL